MELHQLRYFLAVARTGSFVRAAEEEGIAQPSLSQQIKKLETELKAPLFDRLGRSVILTHYGTAFLPHAQSILRETSQARAAIESLRSPDAGVVTVGAIPTVLAYALSEPLAAFQKAYPRVTLSMREATTDKLIENLREGALDLAILALPIKQPEIICSELFRESLLLAVRETSEAQNGSDPVDLATLGSEPMLLLREGHCLRNQVLTTCKRAHAQFGQHFESDHLATLLAMVASGFGVSLVPASAVTHAQGCKLLPIRPASFRRIGYIQSATHHKTPVQKSLVQWLRRWKWSIPGHG